ncbi:MAG: reverse transcriptase-like protein [Bacteroidia bacterium]|nr:reverse transcriptase-like protein [Bacteroidia bacterium]
MYQNQGIEIDVDGSWQADGRIGYGLVIRRDGVELYREGGTVPSTDPDLNSHRQIGGEIYAVVQAVRWCLQHQVQECTIYHDYEGLAHWATGKWRAQKPLTKRYADFIRQAPVRIRWVKVAAHSGLSWNEVAHQLANQRESPL